MLTICTLFCCHYGMCLATLGCVFFVRGSSELRIFYLGENNMTKSFGEHLRNLRIKKGLTQRDAGNYLNINRTTYIHIIHTA